MGNLTIKTLILGMMQTNCYMVYDQNSKLGYIIDPAAQEDDIEQALNENGVKLLGILLTHGHYDHISAAKALSEKMNVPILAGSKEKELLQDARMNASQLFRKNCTLNADSYLADGDELSFGDSTLIVLETPGHTIGGVCFFCKEEDVVFCGDTIFRNSVGRTDFATGNMEQLIQSIKVKLFCLKDEVLLLPGHGEPTTVGYEKNNNPYV